MLFKEAMNLTKRRSKVNPEIMEEIEGEDPKGKKYKKTDKWKDPWF